MRRNLFPKPANPDGVRKAEENRIPLFSLDLGFRLRDRNTKLDTRNTSVPASRRNEGDLTR